MKKKYKIGIDIGGTNTDAVLVDEKNSIIFAAKTSTTLEIEKGFRDALKALLESNLMNAEQIQGIYLGTTHATNAILQQNDLYKVGVIRIAGQNPDSLPSCYGWPKEMRKAIYVDTIAVGGGFHCDGRSITPFNEGQIKEAIARLLDAGAESLAVVGVFSPMNASQELRVKEIANESFDKIPVSLSHQIGGIGFIERENSTILNAALKKVMATGFAKLESIKEELGFVCPLWITQNNGSIINLTQAIEYPVLTISAGPTNSFIGGAKLAMQTNAIVIDIGGTSTDVGVVRKGYPRRCLNNSKIGGITLNFSMPDVLSIALGGGSHVHLENEVRIGPLSCARKFITEGISFGGNQLTFTDIALAMGHINIKGAVPAKVPLSQVQCQAIMNHAQQQIHQLVKKIGIDEQHLPVVMIGGGASLLPKTHFIVPTHASVANAYGAALADISASVDAVVSLTHREKVLEELKEKAVQECIKKGSCNKQTDIVDVQITPYHYVPNQMARVLVTASGPQS